MTRTTVIALTLSLCLAPLAALADRVKLEDDPELWNRLMYTAAANEIRDKCSKLEARTMAATFYVISIVNYAKGLGYSMNELDAWRNVEANQERLRAITESWLDENGVNREAGTGYCEAGEAEMTKKSQIGKLLKRG